MRGATLDNRVSHRPLVISIHAPREGCDNWKQHAIGYYREFQSTHPVRGATQPTEAELAAAGISIHAPREGCDWLHLAAHAKKANFNPRTP